MHVLRYIWKHLSNHDAFDAQCPSPRPMTFCSRWRVTEEARSSRRTIRRHLWMLNVPGSSSCKHANIVSSKDDRIEYYPQTFRIVFTPSSCKRGLNDKCGACLLRTALITILQDFKITFRGGQSYLTCVRVRKECSVGKTLVCSVWVVSARTHGGVLTHALVCESVS